MSAAHSQRTEPVSFPSGALTLRGYLHLPSGGGRHPAMIFNHGSERAQDRREHLANFYTAQGFVLFTPHRHGHGDSPGEYEIGRMRSQLTTGMARHAAAKTDPDAPPPSAHAPESREEPAQSREELMAAVIDLHERYLQDTAAAADWLMRQSCVDHTQVFMSGASHGAIQSLLAAEADVGMQAYVAFAPGATGWRGNPELHERLSSAVASARAPIMVAQAANDFDLGPSEVLGAELRRKGGRNLASIYPAYGASTQDGHGAFACEGTQVWGPDVLRFLGLTFSGGGLLQ